MSNKRRTTRLEKRKMEEFKWHLDKLLLEFINFRETYKDKSDPDIIVKKKELDLNWRNFCNRKNMPSFYTAFHELVEVQIKKIENYNRLKPKKDEENQ